MKASMLESLAEASASRSRDAAGVLNRIVRALIQAPSVSGWKEIVLDGLAQFSARSILIRVAKGELVAEGGRGVAGATFSINQAGAPAIVQALDSAETLWAASDAREISPRLASAFEGAARVLITPVRDSSGNVAVVAAEGVSSVAALELIAAVAGATYRRGTTAEGLVDIRQVAEQRPSHLRAKRFARVKVAEMILNHAPAVETGRRSRNVYQSLRPYIDAAQEEYRHFLEKDPSLPDYLHAELVHAIANDDELLLGAEYSGPLA